MTRSTLLGAVSAAALTFSAGAFAATPAAISGGGSTLAEFDYFVEFAAFNTTEGTSHPNFSNAQPSGNPYAPQTADETLYWPSGSGTGQKSFLYNNLTCDAEAVLAPSTASPHCEDPATVKSGTILETAYGASDATFGSSAYTGWTSGTSYTALDGTVVQVPAQQPIAGNLIELPSMGVGVSIPVVNSEQTSTSTSALVGLQDADLCGIFSGAITNWSTIAKESYNKGKKIAAGTIQVVYRYDGSGTTFIFTEHLANVCPSLGSYPITFKATQTFATLFTTVPSNFVPMSGSQNLASFLSGQTVTNPVTGNPQTTTGSAVGYLSPDFTFVDPSSNAVLNNGAKSTLLVALAYNSAAKKYVLPTYSNVALALTHITSYDTTNGSPTGATAPSSVAQAEADNAFVPVPVTESQGYPLVGYTTFDFAQCYKNKTIGSAIVTFMGDHYNTASYEKTEENNGFVPLKLTEATGYTTAISTYIFPKAGGTVYGTEIGSVSGCSGKTGR
jgi:ABC-type phosphate transport system substrate-binding protein